MELPTKYNPELTEDKWYKHWMEKKYFHSEPDEREPYTIVIPPPNVTGVLHMGHMLNNTLQDVLIRRARMQGKNACWVPGTDHASIATEAKVVNKLNSEGLSKETLGREKFLEHAWEWTHKHGGIILEQLKKLGASCDWERTAFTMSDSLYDSVIDVFIDLYEKGLVYRGVRMINWDPTAKTAVSDEEVVHKELQSKLYYLNYLVEGEDDYITIATTRPETILGDTAVCVHPNDERFLKFHGKKVIVPLVNRAVPIICDEYVDREFGTGALKITPSHDVHDYEIGLKHKLATIDIFNDDGTMSENAELYIGKDRFEVREEILVDLKRSGNLLKVEDYVNKVGFSERTDAVIEPKLSLQWFLKMSEFGEAALEVVEEGNIKFHPPMFKNIYRHWMQNLRDWNISRQLWWGQRIPVFYLPDGEYVVAKTKEEALEKAKVKLEKGDISLTDLKQDEDVFDTWFSSWLWPISVFDGIRNPDNEDINYYYPTNDLITGPDIIFFWVARMIMAGLEYRNKIPFKNVYFTGIVRDKIGRKMSKTLGNSPDPLDLINQYGADGVRVGMLLTAPAGNDLPFDPALCEQGRNFSNKIWNALRLVKGWEVDIDIEQSESNKTGINWFRAKLDETLSEINNHFEKYRISNALMLVYKLIWDDFCSWYLEIVKPAYQKPIDEATLNSTISFFEELMKVLHPFMPFITEEVWHMLSEKVDDDIIVANMPVAQEYDKVVIGEFVKAKDIIVGIRNVRKDKNIPQKERIELQVKKGELDSFSMFPVISKIGNLSDIVFVDEKSGSSLTFTVGAHEFYIPVDSSIDIEAEIRKLEEELSYTDGFLKSVMKKLSNSRFVDNAPAAVVDKERQKQSDAEARKSVIEKQLADLRK